MPDQVSTFLDIFEKNKRKIKVFPGCLHLELLKDINKSNVYFTYSYWQTEGDLNSYRESDFFKSLWEKTKNLFAEKAEAYSLEKVSF